MMTRAETRQTWPGLVGTVSLRPLLHLPTVLRLRFVVFDYLDENQVRSRFPTPSGALLRVDSFRPDKEP